MIEKLKTSEESKEKIVDKINEIVEWIEDYEIQKK